MYYLETLEALAQNHRNDALSNGVTAALSSFWIQSVPLSFPFKIIIAWCLSGKIKWNNGQDKQLQKNSLRNYASWHLISILIEFLSTWDGPTMLAHTFGGN
jgi:hypothetical protein